ncbi:hypothetical protein CROQUDRAFT_103306 [Cronartium quercuum f. sp. fusiforme G11]|uniref:Uncharacterized protein n=1 Tax=Cronartium quercuum f. sp. fusiforme G11 TaxID=708437 RepID=A0A9P6NX46_9BASI|nr:hypothetical protein CROQUDRAFT_103306 [Cronartium quercuum f. sp. fusiforme G11]
MWPRRYARLTSLTASAVVPLLPFLELMPHPSILRKKKSLADTTKLSCPPVPAASLDLDPPECPHLLPLSAIRTDIPLIPGSLPPHPSTRYHRRPGTSQPTPPVLPSSRTHFTGTVVHFHSALTFGKPKDFFFLKIEGIPESHVGLGFPEFWQNLFNPQLLTIHNPALTPHTHYSWDVYRRLSIARERKK